ncbi:hypothetical protein ACP275_05G070900 [Erythranthe tilingii]
MKTNYLFGFVMLLLIVLASQEAMGKKNRICESKSTTFKGICVLDETCRLACLNEGFSDGDCEGLRRRCLCRKPCK